VSDKRFQKTVEDFTCDHCQALIRGTGYTNHCPHCLWSKHVDVNPGDRANLCGGLMAPVALESLRGAYVIIHSCALCGVQKRNRAADNDDGDALIALAASVGQTKRGGP
jgi:hypothetical protein